MWGLLWQYIYTPFSHTVRILKAKVMLHTFILEIYYPNFNISYKTSLALTTLFRNTIFTITEHVLMAYDIIAFCLS